MNGYVNNKIVEFGTTPIQERPMHTEGHCLCGLAESTVHIFLRTTLTKPLLSTMSTEGP